MNSSKPIIIHYRIHEEYTGIMACGINNINPKIKSFHIFYRRVTCKNCLKTNAYKKRVFKEQLLGITNE